MYRFNRAKTEGQVVIFNLIGALIIFLLYLTEFILLRYAYMNILGEHIPPGVAAGDHLILFIGFPLVIGLSVLYCVLGNLFDSEHKSKITSILFCALLAGGIGSFIHAVITVILLHLW